MVVPVSESVLELPTITQKELKKLYTEFYKYAIERRLESFPSVLRLPLRAGISVVLAVLGKRGIELMMGVSGLGGYDNIVMGPSLILNSTLAPEPGLP